MDPVTKRLVPMPDTMRLLGDLGRTKLYELIKDGEITKVKIGSRSFVTAESLDAYLERLVEGAHGRSARRRQHGGYC
jgi:excisionase family DNA binding protein